MTLTEYDVGLPLTSLALPVSLRPVNTELLQAVPGLHVERGDPGRERGGREQPLLLHLQSEALRGSGPALLERAGAAGLDGGLGGGEGRQGSHAGGAGRLGH